MRKTLFNTSTPINGSSLLNQPTGLTFGPDGRLYVGQFDGRIFALTVNYSTYEVTAVQVIETIYTYPTKNDDGSPAPNVVGRQLIGLVFDPASTAANPILYVSHSDIRYGFNNNATAGLIDTHSGTISRLSGPNYASATDVIIGLPRSRENHATNSIVWGPDGWLYIAQASNTNNGAPSSHFSNLPERYLTASILRAKVKDPTFPTGLNVTNVNNASDMLPYAGKFEIYATGYRNVYDLIWNSSGRLYANVNGGNDGYGDTPPSSTQCPGGVEVRPPYLADQLRIVTANSYGGHPNPARGECTLNSGDLQGLPPPPNYAPPAYLFDFRPSTNGITEYISNAFDGALQNNLIVATYGGTTSGAHPEGESVNSIALNPDGSFNSIARLAYFNQPLDVIVDSAGSIFVAEFGGDAITILKPAIVANCPPPGVSTYTVDTDQDGYTNKDEDDNGTDMCSQASSPADFDGALEAGPGNIFMLSDLNDPDDDNDGILDISDQLYFDAANGLTTQMPVAFSWNPGDAPLGRVGNTGFTGVQITNAPTRTIPSNIAVGAAGGYMNIITTSGSHVGNLNTQSNALQIGFDARRPFRIETRLTEAFLGMTPSGNQAAGLFIGTDQDNYIRLVATANRNGNGTGGTGLQFARETNGIFAANPTSNNPSLTFNSIQNLDLRLIGTPATGAISAYYRDDSAPNPDWQLIGTLTNVPFLANGLPAGIVTTNSGSSATVSFVFDYFTIEHTDIVARINAGAAAVTTNGANWSADSVADHPYSAGGSTYILSSFTCPNIQNTTADILYCSERSGGSSTNPLTYTIPVSSSGQYQVRLHFAEIYWGVNQNPPGAPGKRVFDVKMEGTTVLPNYDIIARAGASARAITETLSITVTDGALNIRLDATLPASVDQGKISAIEVWGPIIAPAIIPTATPITPTPITPTAVTPTSTTPTATTGPLDPVIWIPLMLR
ncbi:MAG: PQQ-dependent sugar dehydrogenase [Herpetosiphonaceae bacterium]|nr:PQQ-dependent sugar dehydrogenase [Herpetosiphonaceae bacterium]